MGKYKLLTYYKGFIFNSVDNQIRFTKVQLVIKDKERREGYKIFPFHT